MTEPFLLDRKHTALMLAVIFFATLMDGLDSSIVSVALPDIGKELGIDTGTASWVSIIYMMILAGLIIPFARICANIGVRGTLVIGFALFTASSFFCGISNSFAMLMVSRGMQGVGAAMLAAAGPICCTEHLPRGKLAYGLAILTIGSSIGYALGPAVGGVIVEMISWNWVFLINVPIGLVVIPLSLIAIPASSQKGGRIDLDIVGTFTLFVAMASGFFAIETVAYPDMRTLSAIAGILFVVFGIWFVMWERKYPSPLIKLEMFRDWGFASIFLCLMFVNVAYMEMIYLVPFYGEICVGLTPMEMGLFLFVPAVITAITGMPVSKMSDRWGRRPFCVLAGLVTGATLLLYVIFAETMDAVTLFIILIPQGLGWAFVGGPMASRLVEHAGEERDMAASLTNEAYYIGGSLGLAISAMVFTVFSRSDGVDIADVLPSAFSDGFVAASIAAAVFAFAIAILSYVLRDVEK